MSKIKAATVETCKDDEVHELFQEVLEAHYPDLKKAKVRIFWNLNQSLSNWGSTALPTEVYFLLTRVDIVIRINQNLWLELSPDARRGLMDHFLSLVTKKIDGQTQQQTDRGRRTMYATANPEVRLHHEVMHRNPCLGDEIGALRKLILAKNDSKQYQLELEEDARAAAGPTAVDDDEEAA